MSGIDESNVEKKFQSAINSQESIQSLSMWALSLKSQHEKIVSIWLKVMKSARVELKITLFNLCNEIVQTCRRKHAVVYKDAFKEVLKDATVLARSANIKSNVERIFKIWKERQIYDEHFVKELLAILNCTKVDSNLSSKLLADFIPSKLIRVLDLMVDMEEDSELKRLALPEKLWDSAEIEAIKNQLKDRQQGNEFLAHLSISHSEFASYVASLESEMKQRKELASLLEQGQIYYDTQRGEATIIAMAYKNFTSRVNHQRKKLADTRIYLPDPISNDVPVEEVPIKKTKYSEKSVKDDDVNVSPVYLEDYGEKNENFDSLFKNNQVTKKKKVPTATLR